MLRALTVQNLAVVQHLDVEFSPGLTVLTGETGAGKSILIDALGLALGDRADSTMVRSGTDKATVTAIVDVSKLPKLRELFEQNDLTFSDECILRRVVGADGRSRAFCNATPVPVQLLKDIGEHLVDIHAQHAQQSLLRKTSQVALLDGFGKLDRELEQVAEFAKHWRALKHEQQALLGGVDNVPARIDLLRYQLDELEGLDLDPEALNALSAEHRRVANAARILESCEQAARALNENPENANALLDRALGAISGVVEFDEQLASVVSLLEQARINLDEAERELLAFQQSIDIDPMRLEHLENQLQVVQDLARKHQCKPESLLSKAAELAEELDGLNNRETRINELETEIGKISEAYYSAANTLSKKRREAAAHMSTEVTERIRELGIVHGQFAAEVRYDPDCQPNQQGGDDIEFLVTANPDQDLRPLRKVASGGELSRISLAIQVATSKSSEIPTLVFDEVDTGIGGPTAATVSDYLKTLAERRQILSITHLAQVASGGDHHLVVGKSVVDGETQTTIEIIKDSGRVEEIARMLGGARVTEKSREHARELLAV